MEANDIAARIEAADESQTWEMLPLAWKHIHGTSHWAERTMGAGTRFGMLLNANAPHDAAMMLVGDGFDAYDFKAIIEKLIVDDIGCDPIAALKRLPLAIAAAALRAFQ